MKISELLDDIRKRNLVLPEFQREYVRYAGLTPVPAEVPVTFE